jgi:hypothetical protein
MAGVCAEADAPVGLGAEVAAVEAVPVQVDEPTATRAPASPLRELGTVAAHASNVGAAESAWLDLS